LIGETRYDGIKQGHRPLLIQPLAQNYRGGVTLLIRTASSTAPIVSDLEAIVHRMDPDLPLLDVQSMDRQIATSPVGLLPYRIGAVLAGAQGLIALFLAGLGIFGLVSFNVTRRFREIGVRMALGATRASVLGLIAREVFVLALLGLCAGVLLSVVLTRLFAALLYDVSSTDGLVFMGVTAVVLGATVLATWLPARRATRVSPMEALRCE